MWKTWTSWTSVQQCLRQRALCLALPLSEVVSLAKLPEWHIIPGDISTDGDDDDDDDDDDDEEDEEDEDDHDEMVFEVLTLSMTLQLQWLVKDASTETFGRVSIRTFEMPKVFFFALSFHSPLLRKDQSQLRHPLQHLTL